MTSILDEAIGNGVGLGARLRRPWAHYLMVRAAAMRWRQTAAVSLAQSDEGLDAMWGREKAEELLREAGFRSIEVHELPHDIQNYYYICRP